VRTRFVDSTSVQLLFSTTPLPGAMVAAAVVAATAAIAAAMATAAVGALAVAAQLEFESRV